MKKYSQLSLIFCVGFMAVSGFTVISHRAGSSTPDIRHADTMLYPEEKHFKNIQQLTFEGDNAEAYFSFDSQWLIFQRKNEKAGIQCDQMFIGKIPGPGEK